MLLLDRYAGQSIIIGDNAEIRVTVIKVRQGGQIKIGIEAHKEIPVHREEVYREKEAARREESGSDT